MPSLMRFLTVLAVAAGLAYAGMFALATLVEPNKGEISVRVPIEEPGKPAAAP
ncbi:MAG: histidine kinase [Phyllobacteriaceae bacterium]|nr:histidine kinase [Phyllobacteriaceae bacterium]